MIIGIVPKIKKNRSSFDFSIDNDLISFFSRVFPKSQIKVLLEKRAYQIDLLILSGGNIFLTSASIFFAVSSDIFCCLVTDLPKKTSSSFSP